MGLAGAALLGCSSDDDETSGTPGTTPGPSGSVATAVASPVKRGGSGVVAMNGDVTRDMDPHGRGGSAQAVANMFSHVYVGLTTWEPGYPYVIKGAMAESWETPDPTTYIFNLRKGVKFHHGDVMTAEDVVFSHERNFMKEPWIPPYSSWLRMVDSVVATDEFTVRYTLRHPFLNFLGIPAANRIGGIVSKSFTLANNNDMRTIGSGTGPWRLKEMVPDERVVLERSDSYFEMGEDGQSLPYMDELTYVPITEAQTAVASLRTGEILYSRLSTTDANLLANDSDITLHRNPQGWHLGWSIYSEKPPMNDVRVRRALNLATDRNDLIKKVLTTGWPVMSIPWYTLPDYGIAVDDMPAHYREPNLAEAKSLLTAAGFEGGLDLEVHQDSGRLFTESSAEVLREQWAAIGVNLSITQNPPGWSAVEQGFPGHFSSAPWTSYPDPNMYVYNWLHSSQKRSTSDIPRWNDPKLDDMMDKALIESDEQARIAQYREIQLYIDETTAQLSLYDKEYNEGVHSKLQGYTAHPQNRSDIGMTRAWLA